MGFAGHLGQIKEFHCRQMRMRQTEKKKQEGQADGLHLPEVGEVDATLIA